MKKIINIKSIDIDLSQIEDDLYKKGYKSVCGVDEAGRGPLAGPVVAAAVILPPETEIEGLDDSKKLSASKRDKLFEKIVNLGLICAVGIIDHTEIDRINIHRASLRAMCKAVLDLKQSPDFILVDGRFCIPNLSQAQLAVVGGDACCPSISAASIVAKVTRDRIMEKFENIYPNFSFSTHKGYPTALHQKELKEYGPTEIHRRTFKPVAELIDELTLF